MLQSLLLESAVHTPYVLVDGGVNIIELFNALQLHVLFGAYLLHCCFIDTYVCVHAKLVHL